MFKKFIFIFDLICFMVAVIYYLTHCQNQFEYWAFLALFNWITYNNVKY